jgi:hypothetical protein
VSDKEFVLVSQGVEIYRTKSQENAVNMVKKENDEYFDYCQRCADNYERPADNYIDLEIEYTSEKEKDKEIERLHYIIKEVREYILNTKMFTYGEEKEFFLKDYWYGKELLKILDKEKE